MCNDLISRKALRTDFQERLKNCDEWIANVANDHDLLTRALATRDFICEVLMTIDNAPTVDTTFREVVAYECGQKSVEERPAEWEYTDNRWGLGDWRCSVCDGYSNKDTHYCPNCGARMER